MIAAAKLAALALVASAALGDATAAAFIAGGFTVANTILLTRLTRQHDQLKQAITADRRIVYDQGGHPIGTVLELRPGAGWDDWRMRAGRRHDDDPPS